MAEGQTGEQGSGKPRESACGAEAIALLNCIVALKEADALSTCGDEVTKLRQCAHRESVKRFRSDA